MRNSKGEQFPNSFYEARIIPKPKFKRHYKTTINQCSSWTKRKNPQQNSSKSNLPIHRIVLNQVVFTPGMQSWFNIQKSFSVIHPWIFSTEAEKHLMKFITHVKTPRKLRIKRNFPTDKKHLQKTYN